MNRRVLFISSTGGHLSELLQLESLFGRYDYFLITEKTETTRGLASRHPGRTRYLVFGSKDHLLTYIFKFSYNCLKSLYYYFRIRPAVVVTTGTHTAVPICLIAKLFGKKVIYIESFCNIEKKSLTGRLLYPLADRFFVQWESMLGVYPTALYMGGIY